MTALLTKSAPLTPEEINRHRILRRRTEIKKELRYRDARDDFFIFQKAVMKDPEGNYWKPGAIHREWDEFFNTNPRAVFWAPIEHGKTEQRSIAKTLWLMGRDVTLRQAVIGESYTQAKKILSAIKDYVELDEDFQRVFPDVKPVKGKWTESSLTIERPTISKDPSVLGQGVGGALLGARIDRAILDDVISFLNTLSEEMRDKNFKWLISTLIGRITDRGVLEAIGTAWHHDDAMHRLAKLPAYASRKDRATVLKVSGGGTRCVGTIWAEQWPEERLLSRYEEIGSLEFSRQMLNEALVDGMSRFKMEWFEAAWQAAEENGHELSCGNDRNLPAFTGGDLAVGKKSFHDETQLCTAVLHQGGLRQMVELRGGHWEGRKIVRNIIESKTQHNSMVMIETNAAQEYIRDWVATQGEAISGFVTTGPKKLNPEFGVESLAVELEQGLWSIPRTPETEALAREAVYYDPASHTGDRLMAWWLCREGVRAYGASKRASTRTSKNGPSEGANIMGMTF